MHLKRILFAAFVTALSLSAVLLMARPARAQESVAEAARKAQAARKPSTKPVTVFTNDNLDTIKGSISVVGESPAPQVADQAAVDKDKAKAPVADDKTKTAPPNDKKPSAGGEVYWRKTFAEARKKLADDAHELDVLQREFNLKSQQYYSDPNTAMREQYNRQDLTETKTKIDDKTAAVASDKQAISDLEDELRHAGGEPGWANP